MPASDRSHRSSNRSDQYEARNKRLRGRAWRVGSLTRAEPDRLVITEMSRADSLSDAVSAQLHFGRSHPEQQPTAAAAVREGTPDAKTTVGQRAANAHKCCWSSCVASMTHLGEEVWVCAQKPFIVRAQPCQSTGQGTDRNNRARSGFINLLLFFLHGAVDVGNV